MINLATAPTNHNLIRRILIDGNDYFRDLKFFEIINELSPEPRVFSLKSYLIPNTNSLNVLNKKHKK